MRKKLYTYSETNATFPFYLDENENTLYLARGKGGALFTIPLQLQGDIVEGYEKTISAKMVFPVTNSTQIIINIIAGAINLKVIKKEESGGEKIVTNLKKLRQDTQIGLSFTKLGKYLVEITPLVKTRLYIIKQTF